MADFFARVELHGYATESDYEKLHEEMAKYRFVRKINGKDLPTGTYHKANGISGVETERSNCRTAASATGHTYSLVVIQSADWAGYF